MQPAKSFPAHGVSLAGTAGTKQPGSPRHVALATRPLAASPPQAVGRRSKIRRMAANDTPQPVPQARLVDRRSFLGSAAAFVAFSRGAAVQAQDWARAALDKSPRHREYVSIPAANGRVVTTYVVYPEVAKKAPVVLLIHEIFGLSDWAKLMADEIAAKGYIVLAPDLLSGTGPMSATPVATQAGTDAANATDPHADHAKAEATPQTSAARSAGTPHHLAHTSTRHNGGTDSYASVDDITRAVSALPPEQVMADLDAVASYARTIPSATRKLAVAGFCWGGGKTFSFATHRQGLAAAFVFYGPPPPNEEMARITAPVFGFYAGNDARITATVPGTTLAMKAAGKQYDAVIYPGAGHGFMRAGQAPDATPDNQGAWTQGFTRLTTALKAMQ